MDTPSFRSQHMPVRPSQEHPFLGRDPLDNGCAIFTVIESLQQLGLEGWTARLLSWLGRFEGLERHLEEDCDPVLCVRQILLRHVADQPRGAGEQKGLADATWHSIVNTTMAQPFVHVCCDWSMDGLRPRIRWDPNEHTFLQFLGLGHTDEDLAVWIPASKGARMQNCSSEEGYLRNPLKPVLQRTNDITHGNAREGRNFTAESPIDSADMNRGIEKIRGVFCA